MLAIQSIHMKWYKESRSPQGADERRHFYCPQPLGETALDSGHVGDIFINRLFYIQRDKVYPSTEYYRDFLAKTLSTSSLLNEKQRKEHQRIALLHMQNTERSYGGEFLERPEDAKINGIEIERTGSGYSVFWHSLESPYAPVRMGHNVRYDAEGSPFQGKRLKCCKAFELLEGESGMVRYNYRVTEESAHRYEQFCIYFVNTSDLARNTFTKASYAKSYEDQAVLF